MVVLTPRSWNAFRHIPQILVFFGAAIAVADHHHHADFTHVWHKVFDDLPHWRDDQAVIATAGEHAITDVGCNAERRTIQPRYQGDLVGLGSRRPTSHDPPQANVRASWIIVTERRFNPEHAYAPSCGTGQRRLISCSRLMRAMTAAA